MKTTVRIKFDANVLCDRAGFSYVDHPFVGGVSCYAASAASARKQLTVILTRELNEVLQLKHNWRSRIIGTHAGDVFTIKFGAGGWEYQISGPGLEHSASVLGFESFDDTYKHAVKHIDDAFGGVAWENSL